MKGVNIFLSHLKKFTLFQLFQLSFLISTSSSSSSLSSSSSSACFLWLVSTIGFSLKLTQLRMKIKQCDDIFDCGKGIFAPGKQTDFYHSITFISPLSQRENNVHAVTSLVIISQVLTLLNSTFGILASKKAFFFDSTSLVHWHTWLIQHTYTKKGCKVLCEIKE